MHAIDITRHHFQPAKHYSGLLHYQGSVLLDSEQNEEALIQQGEARRVLTDLLVTSGSPDDGMKIGPYVAPAPPPQPTYDFGIAAGVFYLGGLRLDVEARTNVPATQAEHFALQSEFLQQRQLQPAMANDWLDDSQSAVPPGPPKDPRIDLVWLEAWEQAITGIEDAETVETALQVESSARLRPMRKIHVFPNASDDCGGAFDNLVASLEASGRVTFDPRTAELKSNRRLLVDFVDMGPDPDPCSPPIRRGFLGADNETIQIRVIASDRFAWSFGNAAPLYRVSRNANVLTFAPPPRDELLRPLVGDLIEIIRCDAMLPNGELIGERHGIFHRVVAPFDPLLKQVTIAPAANAVDETNDTTHATQLASDWDLDPPQQYLFARVWRGEAMNSDPVGKPVGAAVKLGDTGVQVTFTGDGPVGDSWTFSVRPNTPEVIVPWEMKKGAPPTAPRRYITGLGLVEWDGVSDRPVGFTDCRRHIRKLEDATGCCEVTVGDGTESFGDVATIDQALARLPSSGGKICLLRGDHFANVLIAGRKNITIEGCGPLTRLHPRRPGLPVIAIADSSVISVRNFAIYASEEIAIAVDDSGGQDFGERTRSIDIRSMQIYFRDAPAIFFNGGQGLKVEQCTLLFPSLGRPQVQGSNAGLSSSIILLGRDMLVERCCIDRFIDRGKDGDRDRGPVQLPLGGIQIVGGSECVEIRRNRIANGGGIGIVLGSVTYVRPGEETYPTRLEPPFRVPWGDYGKPDANGETTGIVIIIWYIISDDGCFVIPVTWEPPIEGNPPVPHADPPIIDCRIIENDIDNMGSSGIAPFLQFDLSRDRQLCSVSDLLIRNNHIIDCARGEAPRLTGGQHIYTARGGIILGWAENLELVANQIEDCGTQRLDPICGVFAVGLTGARISENRINNNGRLIEDPSSIVVGQRGGIVIRHVQPPLPPAPKSDYGMLYMAEVPASRKLSSADALLLHENQVVAPEGRALDVNGIGAMSINDNQFTSLGAATASLFWRLFGALVTRTMASDDEVMEDFSGVYTNNANYNLAGIDHLAGAYGSGATGAFGATPGLAEMYGLDPLPTLLGNAVISVVNFGTSIDAQRLETELTELVKGDPRTDGLALRAGYTGRILFSNNQTRYDGRARPWQMAPCLVGLISLDDAKMTGNQCEAQFEPRPRQLAFVHGAVLATSLQMTANRFVEPSWQGARAVTQLSGYCFGASALMHHNFGSHCFLAQCNAAYSIDKPNASVVNSKICDAAKQFIDPGLRGIVNVGYASYGKAYATEFMEARGAYFKTMRM